MIGIRRRKKGKKLKLSSWMTFRPEGYPIDYTLKRPWRIVWYLRKYRKKNYFTTPTLLSHFNKQRYLLSRFAEKRQYNLSENSYVNLAVVGDLMWVRANWQGFLHQEVKDYLSNFDLVLGNLESPIDRRSPPLEWYKIDAATFNSDPRLLSSFYSKELGRNIFTAVSFANNHTFDRGDEGAIETLKVLKELSILQTGLRISDKEKNYLSFKRKDINFGMCAFCYGYNNPRYQSELLLNKILGLAPFPYKLKSMDLSLVEDILQEMEEEKIDFKIIYIHWGHEFELYPTAVQVELGQKLAAMGFDLIVGSHSHVLQPSEVCFINGYEELLTNEEQNQIPPSSIVKGKGNKPRKSLIHYSLGNFITAMLYWETKFGAIQSIEVFRNPDTKRVDWQFPKVELVYNLLSIHNKGKKELVLLKPYLLENRRKIEKSFPRNRAVAGYLARHLKDQMTEEDLLKGPSDGDYKKLMTEFLKSR